MFAELTDSGIVISDWRNCLAVSTIKLVIRRLDLASSFWDLIDCENQDP